MADGDYNYGNNDRVHTTDDRDKNNATDIGGYPIDIDPDSSWPGLSSDPNKQRYDVDKMRDIVGKILDLAEPLRGNADGTPQNLSQAVGQAKYGPQDWYAAKYLTTASNQVSAAVAEFGQQLIGNLDAAANAIKTAADTYEKADNANERGQQNQMGSLDGTQQSFG